MSSTSSQLIASDVIRTMALQEERFYRCSDYLAHERRSSSQEQNGFEKNGRKAELTKSISSVCVKDMENVENHNNNQGEKDLQESGECDSNSDSGPSDHQQTFSFWRQQMFDWACMVTDSFGMDRYHCVSVCMNLLDRYVSTEMSKQESLSITRDDFQLFSMTCLYMAVKILEPYPRKISLDALVDMSRGFYSSHDVECTERDILAALQWRLHAPTAVAYTREYWQAFPLQQDQPQQHPQEDGVSGSDHPAVQLSATLTELALADASFCAYPNSFVGLAACCLALQRCSAKSDAHRLCHELVLPLLLQDYDQSQQQDAVQLFSTIYRQLEDLYGSC